MGAQRSVLSLDVYVHHYDPFNTSLPEAKGPLPSLTGSKPVKFQPAPHPSALSTLGPAGSWWRNLSKEAGPADPRVGVLRLCCLNHPGEPSSPSEAVFSAFCGHYYVNALEIPNVGVGAIGQQVRHLLRAGRQPGVDPPSPRDPEYRTVVKHQGLYD